MKTALLFALASLLAVAQAPKKIVVYGVADAALAELRAAAPGANIVRGTGQDTALLADAAAIIAPPSADVFALAPKLEWVQISSAGVERIAPALRSRNVTLTNLKILQGPEIADHALALLLALTRQLPQAVEFKGREEWSRASFHGVELNGKTAVVIGVGGIGMQIAQRAHAFGMTVIGVDPKEISYTYFLKQVVPPDRLDTVLPRADVVFISAPLTDKSRRMMGERQFGLLRKGSYFVAVSRGGLYDTGALVKALDEKRLAGAGLDVTDPEPLPKGHPLWKFPNVVVTPHSAGGSDMLGGRMLELYKDNIQRFLRGEPMRNVVDKDKGY